MPENYSDKTIYLNSDAGTEHLQNTSGWYLRNNNNIRKKKAETNIDVERHKTLRIKDSTIKLPGVMRFNSTLQQFQGYTGNLTDSAEGWTSFQTFNGINGKDGVNSISEMVGLNVSSDANTFGIFKDITSETLSTSTTADIVLDNQVENIYTSPSYTFSSFNYPSPNQHMDLSNKTLTFIPYLQTSFKVFVRENDMYPPVSYYSHTTVRTLNEDKIDTNNHYRYYLQGKKFIFYNTIYSYVYIHQNGYLNFVGGDSSLLTGNYPNHFSNYRISAFLNNLINNSTGGETNQADIHVGLGPYGETVITYNNFSAIEIDPNNSSNSISDNYNNFQIRLWTENVGSNYGDYYSDDHYPPGTIQISYGKSQHQTPLVGISNTQTYDETTFVPLPFSNLLDNEYTEVTGLGVPQLNATFVFEIPDSSQASILASNSNFQDLGQIENSGNLYKLIIKNKNWTSSFSEKYNGVYYYTRIMDLGPVNGIEKFYCAIQGLHDLDYSDISNKDADDNIIDLSEWNTIDKLTDISNIYSSSRDKDYLVVYNANAFNTGNHNSYLSSIQMRYTDANVLSTSGSATTRLYTGSTEKRLLVKIIYKLRSDVESPTGNTSFNNATNITLSTPITDSQKFIDNGNEEFHFIPGSSDYFKFSVDVSKSYQIELFDNSPDTASRNNYGLSMELYKQTGEDTEPILYKSSTDVNLNIVNNLNTYPGTTIDQELEFSNSQSTKTFYLVVSGTMKSYYYGIRIKESTSVSLTTNILTLTVSNLNYNSLSSGEREALKEEIKKVVAASSSSDTIELSTVTRVILERTIASDGTNNITATVVFSSSTIGELQDIVTNFNTTPPSITFNVSEVSTTRELSNPAANTTTIANLPTDTVPIDDDDLVPPEPPSNQDYTPDNILTLKKANFLSSQARLNSNYNDKNYFDLYYHTSIVVSNKIYYCYFVLDFNTSGSSLDLVLHVFNKSESNVFNSITVDSITFSSLDNLINYPFNIFNQDNTIVVLYGSGTNESKSFNLKKYAITNLDSTINIQLENTFTNNDSNKQNTIFKQNHGVVDSLGNIYCMEVVDTSISIVKFNNTLTKSTQSNISGLTYSDSNYLKLYSSRDRFNSLTYLYLFNKASSSNYTVKRININQVQVPTYFVGGRYGNEVAFIRTDGTVYYNDDDEVYPQAAYNTVLGNNQLNEIVDYLHTEYEVIVRSKGGNTYFWYYEAYSGDNGLQNLTNVVSIVPNNNAVAFLRQENGNKSVSTAGRSRQFGAGKERYEYTGANFSGVTVGNNIVSIHATYGAFAALTQEGKIKTWGQFSSSEDANIESRDYGGNHQARSGITSDLVFTQIFSNENSFAALTDDRKLYTWGNLFSSYKGNRNPVDSSNSNTNYIQNVYHVRHTQYAWAVLVPDKDPTTEGWEEQKTFKVICFGGIGQNYNGDYNLYNIPHANNQNNYGEFMFYWDYDSAAADKTTSQEPNNSNIKELYSNDYAFAALTWDNKVITWGESSEFSNSGGSPYYFNKSDNPVSVKSKLASGVNSIVSNDSSFLAIKDEEIVVWGQKDYGGSPIINNYTSNPPAAKTNYTGLTASNVIPNANGYAIFQNGEVNFIGYDMKLNGNSYITSGISNIVDVQTTYVPYPNKNLANQNYYHPFVVTKTDNSVFLVTANTEISIPAPSITSNFSPVDNSGDSIVNDDLVNYDYILNNINQRNNIVFSPLKDDYFYLKYDSNYKLFRNRREQSILSLTNLNNEDNIVFLQFEFIEGNHDYLLIVYQDLVDSTNKLVVIKLGDLIDDISILTHSITSVQGVKIIQNKLYNYYYNTSGAKKFVVEVYELGESAITGPSSPVYEIYNVDNESLEDEIVMPEDYVITQAFGNALTADNNNATPSFFMVAKNDTEVNTNKFNYFLFQFDINYDSRKGMDFSEYAEITPATNLAIEETKTGDPDILELEENIIDNISPESNYHVSYILEKTTLAIYESSKTLYLKIYDDYDFVEHEIKLADENIQNLRVVSSFTVHSIFWETENNTYVYQIEYQGSGDIKVITEKSIPLLEGKNITNILKLEDSIIFGYFNADEDKYLIVKLEDGNETNILELPSNINLKYLGEAEDIIYIFTDKNTYYELNLDTLELDSNYILIPVKQPNILIQNQDRFYIGNINGILHFIKNNGPIVNLGISTIKIHELRELELNGNKNNLLLIYSEGETDSKTILVYNLETGDIKINNFRFNFCVNQVDSLLLFHSRQFNKKITVRYVNLDLETLYLNQFEKPDYNFKRIEFLYIQDEMVEFWGLKKDEDDIEESNAIFKLKYQNVSNGKYPTYSYSHSVENVENENENENIILEINNPQSVNNSIKSSSRSVLTDNNLVLELVAEVDVVLVESAYKYIFEHKQLDGSGLGTYDSDNDYRLTNGTYILKNVPYNYPIAVLVNTATGDKNMITYRGLSYNNLNPNNVGSSLVKQVTEDSETHFYYFYYGDVEIKVLGNFGSVSFYSYNNGYMGGEKKLIYQTNIDRNPDIESNNLYEREGNNRILKFPYYGGDSINSNYVIGRATTSSYTDNDSGTNLFTYVKSYYKSKEESCFYIRSNGIPNYQPSIFGKVYHGNWVNEAEALDLDNKNYYAVYYQSRGWFDTSNLLQGQAIKIPIEPRIASQNIYTSKTTFQENFWYTDDIYWKTIMEDTKYSSKLLTPMGPIAVAMNGVSFYNFAIMQNRVTDTYSSASVSSGNFDYETSSNLVITLSTNNSETVINGVENSITNTQIFDNQGGTIDLNHHYHYHYYPITLEGQIFFGTVKNRDVNNEILFLPENLVPTENFKLYIGHTYYLNVNEASNRNTSNENIQVGFALNTTLNNYLEEYNFNNTLVRSGDPGLGVGPYVKFKIPNTLTTQNSLQLVRVKNNNNQTPNSQDLIVPSYGGFYNKTTVTNTNPHIDLGYRPVGFNLDILNDKFLFRNSEGDDFNTENMLFFERDVIYTINLGVDYKNGNYNLGFKRVVGSSINIYGPEVLNETSTQISLRFNEEVTNLFIYNTLNEFDNSGSNYPIINVYQPESIHYYTRVDTEKFKFYNFNSFGNFTFNGQLEWEDAYFYLTNKKIFTGPIAHSPILGYAFDGFPIYGPLGYDKSTTQYYSDNESSIPVKFLKSSYTYDNVDSNGNPTYEPNLGDLDFCNGIFSKTPEFPQGVYHYICTIKLDSTGNPALEEDSSYGFRNVPKKIIKPAYPYVIGAYKGVPELSNFPWATPNGSTSNTNIEKKKFTFNFKSIKSENVIVNGKSTNSISITQDENNLKLLVNPQSYKWNFSNTIQTSIFGRDDTIFGNKISDLISTGSDTTLKCYGKVTKWTSSGLIFKGTCVTLTNKTVEGETLLCAKTYTEKGLSEQEEHVAILGIALNDVTADGGEVYVCEEGITTVVINNTASIKCSSYGVISILSGNTGRVVALDANTNILSNTPVVGIFLETKDVELGEYCLFRVKPNYEFN